MNGEIHLYRRFLNKGKFSFRNRRGPITEFEAIIDIVDKSDSNGKFVFSSTETARDWGWYPKKVTRFLDKLLKEGYLKMSTNKNYFVVGYAQWYGAEKSEKYIEITQQILRKFITVTGKTKTQFDENKVADIRKCFERPGGSKLSVEDFYRVIDFKYAQWKDNNKMKQYIQWSTWFGTSNFNKKYIEEARNVIQKSYDRKVHQ